MSTVEPDLNYGLTENEIAAAKMMNALLAENAELREAVSGVIGEIAAERARQIAVEGYDHAHDDERPRGKLALAAAAYAEYAGWTLSGRAPRGAALPQNWPWSREAWKPRDERRNLVRAAALIVAEIERLDRLAEVSRSG